MTGYGIQLFEELFENQVLVVQVFVGQFLIQHFYLMKVSFQKLQKLILEKVYLYLTQIMNKY